MFDNDITREIIINNHRYIQFNKLLDLGVNHCITENDLNFSFKYQDLDQVQNNINIVCNDLGFNSITFSRPGQTHSNHVKILEITGINAHKDTDGLITNQKNIPIGITTADCISIIVYDPNKNVIANVHSGWKGTLNTIILNTIDKMIDTYNCNVKDMLFFFGPSICKDCFVVKDDVKDLYEEKFGNKHITKSKKENEYYIDTVSINVDLLKEKGIPQKNVYLSNICTHCNSNKLHSYRARKDKSTCELGITIVTL